MAINTESTRFLIWALSQGVSYKSTLSLGRQLFCPSNREVQRLFREYGLHIDWLSEFPDTHVVRYAEPFWKALGATRIDSMDASPYEGASLIHDLNKPVSADAEDQFDVVFDGGTLEHVFDLPVALSNCLRMVKVGGHFISTTHANNYCGHGFYQFSPELFYRALSKTTGFEVRRLVLVEFSPFRRWFDVADPDEIRRRTIFVNAWPVMLFVLARKERRVQSTLSDVQQSDYRAAWAESPGAPGRVQAAIIPTRLVPSRARKFLKMTIPGIVRCLETLLYSRFNPVCSLKNRKVFRKVNKKTLRSRASFVLS